MLPYLNLKVTPNNENAKSSIGVTNKDQLPLDNASSQLANHASKMSCVKKQEVQDSYKRQALPALKIT